MFRELLRVPGGDVLCRSACRTTTWGQQTSPYSVVNSSSSRAHTADAALLLLHLVLRASDVDGHSDPQGSSRPAIAVSSESFSGLVHTETCPSHLPSRILTAERSITYRHPLEGSREMLRNLRPPRLRSSTGLAWTCSYCVV